MISDVIHVSSDGSGVAEALLQAEKAAAYRELNRRNALHLRLFAEEMLGMMQALTGEREADFRIESDGMRFRLYLKAKTEMNAQKREQLLAVSTSGENAAVKGFMGKIKDVFERAHELAQEAQWTSFSAGCSFPVTLPGSIADPAPAVWTMSRYKEAVQNGDAPQDDWDELEHSVISKLADEVEISIGGGTVEMTVYKQF